MDIKEAYKILGVSEDISDDELKKIHRKLSFQFHPDRNKDEPNKLAEINSAFQLINDYRQNPSKYRPQIPGGFNISFEDIFSNFGFGFDDSNKQKSPGRNQTPPIVEVNISFKESVLGCEKEISYKRIAKCEKCDGKGMKTIGNGCSQCNGFGRILQQRPGMMFSTNCTKCHSRGIKSEKCEACKATGGIEGQVSCNVYIPAGVMNDAMLNLQHAGHFIGQSMFSEGYGSVYVKVGVETDPDLKLVEMDVICDVNISLAEALKGCKKEIRTIFDKREIDIAALVKHKDQIILDGCGVPKSGVQRIIVNVQYPDDVNGLVEYLEK